MASDYEVESVKYLDCYPKLPIDAPIGCPHIIDLDSMNPDSFGVQDMSIADVVVTILFKFTPCALTAFLDLNRPNFHYIQAGGTSRLDFCIKRDKRMVTVRLLQITYKYKK